jgi:hypothetical protein
VGCGPLNKVSVHCRAVSYVGLWGNHVKSCGSIPRGMTRQTAIAKSSVLMTSWELQYCCTTAGTAPDEGHRRHGVFLIPRHFARQTNKVKWVRQHSNAIPFASM